MGGLADAARGDEPEGPRAYVLKIGSVISATGYAATSLNAMNSVEFTLPDGRTFTTGNEKWCPVGGR